MLTHSRYPLTQDTHSLKMVTHSRYPFTQDAHSLKMLTQSKYPLNQEAQEVLSLKMSTLERSPLTQEANSLKKTGVFQVIGVYGPYFKFLYPKVILAARYVGMDLTPDMYGWI